MIFLFDEGLESEKSIEMSYYNEQVKNRKLNASKEYKIEKSEDFPDISGFGEDVPFTTLSVTDGKIVVPIIGNYDVIESFNASYSSISRTYIINMILGVKAK